MRSSALLRVCVAFTLLLLTIASIGCGGSASTSSNPSNPGNPANPGSPGQPGSNPGGSSSPEFLYVSTMLNPQIFGFAINPGTGKLSAVSGSPFSDTTVTPRVCTGVCDAHPFILAGDPGGKYLYAIDGTTGVLNQYKVDSSGKLTLNSKAGTAFSGGFETVVHPSGNFVYYVDSFDLFSYQANPMLTPTPGSPQHPGQQMDGVAASTNFVYAVTQGTGNDISIVGYRVDPTTGSLTQILNQPPPDPNAAGGLLMTPDGHFLYYTNSRKIFVFRVDPATGALTLQGSLDRPPDIVEFFISPNSSFAYISGVQGTLTTYRIDPNTGMLTSINVETLPGQTHFAIDSAGKFAYSVTAGFAGANGNQIFVYSIDGNGILHQIDTTTVSMNDTFGTVAVTQTK